MNPDCFRDLASQPNGLPIRGSPRFVPILLGEGKGAVSGVVWLD